MKKAIWKFELTPDNNLYEMPKGAKILCVQTQNEKPMVWALVDPDAEKEKRELIIIPTGAELFSNMADNMLYIGTFQVGGGSLVFHVFEIKNI